MIAQYLLLTAIGLLIAGPFCLWVLADARQRHNAAAAYAAGFRAGQRAGFEAEARTQVARQSARLQATTEEGRRRLERTYRGMERRQAHADGLARSNEVTL